MLGTLAFLFIFIFYTVFPIFDQILSTGFAVVVVVPVIVVGVIAVSHLFMGPKTGHQC